jgi:hypothetical protein
VRISQAVVEALVADEAEQDEDASEAHDAERVNAFLLAMGGADVDIEPPRNGDDMC